MNSSTDQGSGASANADQALAVPVEPSGLASSGFDPSRERLPLTPAFLSQRLGEFATFVAVGEPFNPAIAERLLRAATLMIATMHDALLPFAKLARPKTAEPGAYTPIECFDTLYGGTGELRLSSHTEATSAYEILWASDFERAAIAMEARQGEDSETRPHPKDDSAGPKDIAND